MAALTRIASGRPAFNAGGKTLTFDVAELAPLKGQLLVAIAAFDAADSINGAIADGWTVGLAFVGTAKITVLLRTVDDDEPEQLVLALTSAAKDWLGALLLYDRGAPNLAIEASAGGSFAADATPPAAAVSSQQAINLRLGVWDVAGAIVLTAPAGWTQIDSYSTAIATARSLLVAEVIANATGNLGAVDATAGAAATGSGLSLVLRATAPSTPATLDDPLPGNIGLFGTDARPPREAGLP